MRHGRIQINVKTLKISVITKCQFVWVLIKIFENWQLFEVKI